MLAGGAEVAQSEVDGKPVGPLRVWPGGLAMSRTLGDLPAGDVCTSEPDVRQVRDSECVGLPGEARGAIKVHAPGTTYQG